MHASFNSSDTLILLNMTLCHHFVTLPALRMFDTAKSVWNNMGVVDHVGHSDVCIGNQHSKGEWLLLQNTVNIKAACNFTFIEIVFTINSLKTKGLNHTWAIIHKCVLIEVNLVLGQLLLIIDCHWLQPKPFLKILLKLLQICQPIKGQGMQPY